MLQPASSSNPVFKKAFAQSPSHQQQSMSVEGTINKTAALLAITALSAAFAWQSTLFSQGLWLGVMLVGLVLAWITYAKPHLAHITAPLYGAAKGIVLGSVSAMLEAMYPGIALNALILTFGILGVMLTAYRTGLVRATPKLQKIITFGLMAYFGLFVVSMLASLFGADLTPIFHQGPIAIGLSLVIVALASFCLVLDFDEIEQGARQGLPKQHEWLGAFGLLVTLIWIYWEALRLLMILNSSDD
jgi:uncharacterized YccA/Bax inhibitor family protein